MIIAAVAGAPAGCASAPREPRAAEAGPRAASTEALARLMEREQRRPSARARTAPVPPGVEAMAVRPVDSSDVHARAPFSEVVRTFAAQEDPLLNVGADLAGAAAHVDRDDQERALRLYVMGRSRRLAGDARTAVADLTESVELDPAPAEPWLELAEAQVGVGDRLSALSAFRTALTRDPTAVRALVEVGQSHLERRDAEGAARLLARAWGETGPADAGMRRVVAMSLGSALHELGHLTAGNEALAIALDLPERFSEPTIYRDEVAVVYRDRAELWRDFADAAARLGRYEEALAGYDRSAQFPSFDPGALAPRRVHAAMRLGRPALAASLVLGEIQGAEGRVEDRHFRLIEFISRHSEVGPDLAAGVAAIESGLTEDARRLTAGRLARARAAALEDAPARAELRKRVAQAPTDQDAIEALFGRIDPQRPRDLLEETIRLIEAAPLEEPRYVGALLRVRPEAAALLAEMSSVERAPEPAAGLLRASLMSAAGDDDAAEHALRAIVAAHPRSPAPVVALARLLGRDGRPDEAEQTLALLSDSEDPDVRFARATALGAMDLHEEALFVLKPALEPGPGLQQAGPTAREAILAAQASLQLERWAAAEKWCRAAIAEDPSTEDAYAGLIALYAPSGPLADQRRLTDTVRQLRVAIPSSRTLRWLRAQDLLRAGQFDAAERDLLGLAEEEPSASVVDALVSLWIRTRSTDRAESWLRENLAERPGDPPLVAQLARVLAETARASEAETLLRNALALRPRDPSLQRALETVLRDGLGRADEADAMAAARLESMAPSLERSIELAELRLRRNDVPGAIDALLAGMTRSREPRPESAARLSHLAAKIASEAAENATLQPRAAELLGAALDFLPESPVQLHAMRLELLCAGQPDAGAISAALGLASVHHPQVGDELAERIVDQLVRASHQGVALAVVERAVRRSSQASDRLLAKWLQLSLNQHDSASAVDAIRATVDRGAANRILTAKFDTPEAAGADLAYKFAAEFSRAPGRTEAQVDEDTERLYRLALRYQPAHPMANNNLGYRLIERHERVEEAMRMLETAYEGAPDEPAIVDSLAWARYKLGQFRDEHDVDGALVREGAVTLLKKAVDLPNGTQDPTILDHLGDALWRIDERGEAVRKWEAARTIARDILARRSDLIAEFGRVLEGLERKIQAAGEGAQPAVAPTFDEPMPAPAGAEQRPAPAGPVG